MNYPKYYETCKHKEKNFKPYNLKKQFNTLFFLKMKNF